MHLVCHDIVDLVILGHDSWYLVLLCLRVSSLVRFYKSRFWFFSEKFLNQISEIFLKNFWIQRFSAANHSKMKETSCFAAIFKLFALLLSNFDEFQKFFRNFSENFWNISEKLCIQKFSAANHSKMKETSCFAAVFKLFCCYFHTFCVAFLEFWRISEIFQKNFSEIFWKISEKFLKYFWKIYESRNFLLPTIQKWRKLAVLLLFSSCFAAIFILFALLFSNFDEFQKCFRKFSEIFQKFLKIFWKISEIFLKNLWLQRFSAANHSKMKETSCFQSFQLVFHTFGSSQVPKVEEN